VFEDHEVVGQIEPVAAMGLSNVICAAANLIATATGGCKHNALWLARFFAGLTKR
jgi:hypothetical protein